MPAPSDQFVHLHVHSQFSLLDGACRTGDLPGRAKELGMSSVAITDHGCLFGIVDFFNKSIETGVKPILGIEAYMAPGDRRDRTYSGTKDGGYHLLMLAQNHAGYRNLLKLASIAYLEGFYFKPRIDKATLKAHADGLIVTSACLGGEIPTALTADDRKKAKAIAEEYLSIFGPDRFFIELQSHIPEQAKVNPELVDLADRLGVGVVATNDVHFLLEGDHEPHDALCCISTGKLISDESRMKYPTQLYLKSPAEMRAACPSLGARWLEACDNTVRIADMCDVAIDFKANHAPVVKIESKVSSLKSKVEDADSATLDLRLETLDSSTVGSTDWYKRFCGNFELHPFNSLSDSDSPTDLKRACDDALRKLTEAGALWRYGEAGITPDIRARIDRELSILADKSISAYFLIVWDFVNFARAHGIPATARGSGVGTMVGYCLGLSNACPVKYGLLFERFTDPDRSEYPDIDIDICQDGRARVIDYVRKKYGHVAQIITFGTLKAKAAIKDVARVMGLTPQDGQALSNLVPDELNITLDKALTGDPDFRKEYHSNLTAQRVIDTAKRLEGLTRHAGIHAAGVIVATQPLDNIVPLYRDPKSGEAMTQWDGPTCEKVGLLKMDFLGLRTLSIVERCKKLINATMTREQQLGAITGEYGLGPRPDTPREFGLRIAEFGLKDEESEAQFAIRNPQSAIDPLDLDRLTFVDQNVLDLFRRGETAGVFQFESGGMRSLLMGMQPDRLEDLIAANALFRPGPMDLIPDYNDRKNRRKSVPPAHPVVEKYTAETYGIMVYQEQVMQIIHDLGDIPLREAYSIIKAISKKKHKTIAAAREQFVEGAAKKDLAKPQAAELFDLIEKFAGYGFNKSHSTGYAIVAYQTAYLKTYFPVHYMAALLTYESVSIEKVTEYIDECRKVRKPNGSIGIEVRPPDINLSYRDFSVVFAENEPHGPNHGHIRFGLGAVKGVGAKAVDGIIEQRKKDGPFTSLFNFCERIPGGVVNKATVEALIKCGAFDTLHGSDKRCAMVAALETALSRGAQEASLRNSDDFLFGAVASSEPAPGSKKRDEPALPAVQAWTTDQTLAEEKSVLGFYVSDHPLKQWAAALERYASVALRDTRRLRAETMVIVGGMITRVRQTLTRAKQEKMAILTIEDLTGTMEAVAFPRTFAECGHLLAPERIVFFEGKIDRKREEPNLLIERVIPVEEAVVELTRGVHIVIRDHTPDGALRKLNGELSALKTMLRQSAGRAPVTLEVHAEGNVVTLEAPLRVQPDPLMPQRVEGILRDRDCCTLNGPAKLLAAGSGAASRVVLDETEPTIVVDRLPRRAAGEDDEFCESIDRY